MRIIIQKEGEEDQVFEDVIEYALTGIQGKVMLNDFFSYTGKFKHLMEKAHSMYVKLKDLFLKEDTWE